MAVEGKRRLVNAAIDTLQNYHDLAICKIKRNLVSMT